MAKPAGAIETPNLKMQADFTSQYGDVQSGYFIFKAPIIPQDYQTDNRPDLLYPHRVTRQVNIGTGATLSEYWRIGEIAKPALATSPATKAGAYSGEVSDAQIQYPTGNRYGKAKSVWQPIRYIIAKWDFHSSDAGITCDIYNVSFRSVPDTAYSGTGVEMLRRDTAAQRLYKDDMPCSAWHIMYGLIESHEKILSENINAFCIPVFGDPGAA